MKKLDTQKPEAKEAVLYCRVSTPRQKIKGDGLHSQETRCREYAKYKGYKVVQVFKDDITGKTAERPGLHEMLDFLRKNRPIFHAVIIDDITRLARNVDAHLRLRTEILKAGGILESPSIEFGDDPDTILVENVMASVSQHQGQKNALQVKNRMKARIQNGYWPFPAPKGYRYKSVPEHYGKFLVRDEPIASIVQEALEGFASGRFETKTEVKRFLESEPAFPKDLNGREVRLQRVSDLLTQILYAGYIACPKWEVGLRKGKHEGLISFETFERIQARLESVAKSPARKDIDADFPLRGFILCDDCGRPLTACWSKSKTKKMHPYYFCKYKGCVSYGKSIRRGDLEGAFEFLLENMEPSTGLYDLAEAMFRDVWNIRLAQAEEANNKVKLSLRGIDEKIEKLFDRIVDASNQTIIRGYEQRIDDLERQKALAKERLQRGGQPLRPLEESFELALCFLSNPWKIWENGDLAQKKTVLRLAFSERLPYSRNQGLRTPKIAYPFKVLDQIQGGNCKMVELRGIEPLTSRVRF